jgi:hypothetical protein
LERSRIGEEERVQQAVSKVNDENRQLKSTVDALRAEMERNRFTLTDQVDKRGLEFEGQMLQLKDTIIILRKKLEKAYA